MIICVLLHFKFFTQLLFLTMSAIFRSSLCLFFCVVIYAVSNVGCAPPHQQVVTETYHLSPEQSKFFSKFFFFFLIRCLFSVELDRKLSSLNHSFFISLTRSLLAIAAFEAAVWSSRPLITLLRAKTAAIWEACQYKLSNTAIFLTVEDMLGNCRACEMCPEVEEPVLPSRDYSVTTCPPPPSCKKVCPEVTTVLPSIPRN